VHLSVKYPVPDDTPCRLFWRWSWTPVDVAGPAEPGASPPPPPSGFTITPSIEAGERACWSSFETALAPGSWRISLHNGPTLAGGPCLVTVTAGETRAAFRAFAPDCPY
jgi:hypothetical protein